MRPHIAAVYAFARTADDFADEGQLTAEERRRPARRLAPRLRHGAAVAVPGRTAGAGEPPDVAKLCSGSWDGPCERSRCRWSCSRTLLSAFRQDVTVTPLRDVVASARSTAGGPPIRSAASSCGSPTIATSGCDQWSDAICTALQLTNFWQDLRMDCDRGRIYVPSDDLRAHGAE